MAHTYAPFTPTLLTNSSKYLTECVVVATVGGLGGLPERVRRRLVGRWGVVHALRDSADEVMVHYPARPGQVEMLVPFSLNGATLEVVTDEEAVQAWRRGLEEFFEKRKRIISLRRRD